MFRLYIGKHALHSSYHYIWYIVHTPLSNRLACSVYIFTSQFSSVITPIMWNLTIT